MLSIWNGESEEGGKMNDSNRVSNTQSHARKETNNSGMETECKQSSLRASTVLWWWESNFQWISTGGGIHDASLRRILSSWQQSSWHKIRKCCWASEILSPHERQQESSIRIECEVEMALLVNYKPWLPWTQLWFTLGPASSTITVICFCSPLRWLQQGFKNTITFT